jgi:outer membrane protein OmpA-like peptidoglycan-associated protein
MTQHSAPQGVHLLKQLLFDREAKRLDDLGRRLEADAADAARRHKETSDQQKALSDKIDVVFERAGSAEKLQHSVADIIDGALREAEVVRHEPLSRAIAPLVIRTIKVQLRDSQDEMVEALYPITGRLVQSYVQSAMAEMMVKINAKLGGGGAAAITAQSDATGVSAGELALSEANKLEVEELFLVRRGTGELVAHWERPDLADRHKGKGGANRDQLFSGYLTGIMSLSEEAFGATPGSFRTLELTDGDRIFVRGSAAHLLAVRCSGSGGPAVEQVIDKVFLDTIERYQQVLAADLEQMRASAAAGGQRQSNADEKVDALLPEMGRSIEVLTAERRAALLADQVKANAAATAARAPNFGRVYAMAALLAAPFILWGAWSIYQTIETTRTESAVKRVLAATDEIQGVPPRVEVERGGRALTISGFVPTGQLREQIMSRLAQEAPQARIRDQLGVLPAGAGPAEIAIAELKREVALERRRADLATLVRPIERAKLRLTHLRGDIERVLPMADSNDRASLQLVLQTLEHAGQHLASAKSATEDGNRMATALPEPLKAAWLKLNQAEAEMAALLASSQKGASTRTQLPPPVQLELLAEDVSMAAERLSAAELGLAQALALKAVPQRIGGLDAKIDRLRPPTAMETFEALVRASAVFFENGTDLRDATLAQAVLDRLAKQMRELPDVMVRVVGYTDERGGQAINSGLAQQRADRVAALLAERGIVGNRIVSVGRLSGKDLSRSVGPSSANRRVEFEIGFPGEAGGSP